MTLTIGTNILGVFEPQFYTSQISRDAVKYNKPKNPTNESVITQNCMGKSLEDVGHGPHSENHDTYSVQ